ncbi:hypothetical protein ACJX0J_020110, partial [Zea mays]
LVYPNKRCRIALDQQPVRLRPNNNITIYYMIIEPYVFEVVEMLFHNMNKSCWWIIVGKILVHMFIVLHIHNINGLS